MKTCIAVVPLLLTLALSTLPCGECPAEEPIRGLVVDVSDGMLWLGLPSPVRKGAVFDVRLIGGTDVIARAEVIQCTADSPFVAQARYAVELAGVKVPIGAYVETGADAVATRWEELGYEPRRLERGGARSFGLEIGAFLPTKDSLADQTSDVWLAMELSYRLSESERCETRIAAGYCRGRGDFEILGIPASRSTSVYPVMVDVKLRAGREGWFARIGAGGYIFDDKTTIAGTSTSDNETRFGWRAGLGYESKAGKFVQVAYADVRETDFEGVQLTLGARF